MYRYSISLFPPRGGEHAHPILNSCKEVVLRCSVYWRGAVSGNGVLARELTGTLYGKVLDPTGLPIPGATTISSPQLIKDSEVRVTNADGVYRVPVLPPGTYRVQVEMDGFQTVTCGDIALRAGAVLAVDVTLQLSARPERQQEQRRFSGIRLDRP
jgi:hypothetical protein